MFFVGGEGELESQIRDYVKKQNLENNVIFGEVTNRIEEVYQIMDCFCLPSLFEGLPVVSY
uniref:CAZy families GT4 protein n=1 Tax=uncultured Lactobacillus sp. TaxID=153152 RepID=A0A060CPU6_9LACO|nr:CAZy families GT4 protein [uncultured Lactobacillus sp.]